MYILSQRIRLCGHFESDFHWAFMRHIIFINHSILVSNFGLVDWTRRRIYENYCHQELFYLISHSIIFNRSFIEFTFRQRFFLPGETPPVVVPGIVVIEQQQQPQHSTDKKKSYKRQET